MKRNLITIAISLIILLICLSGCISRSQGDTSKKFISKNDAINAVRTFEGDQNLHLKVDIIEKYEEGPEWNHDYFYPVDLIAKPDPEHSWEVNAITGEVNYASYYDRIPKKETKTPYGKFTQTQCRQIALNFIKSKYHDFDEMGFQLVRKKWDGNGWSFHWNQLLQNGAITDNFINIAINSDTGLVQDYVSERYKISKSKTPPKLTPQQAVKSAVKKLGITSALTYDKPIFLANPDVFYYMFKIEGKNIKNEWQNGICEINANTGVIIAFHQPG